MIFDVLLHIWPRPSNSGDSKVIDSKLSAENDNSCDSAGDLKFLFV